MSKSDIAVSVRGLSKSYTIVHNQEKERDLTVAMLKRLRNPFQRPKKETFWALKDVSFDIKKGDVVGIIGRNGAGKSTLLKILSRITEPTTGRIDLYGRVGSLLEVGTGFHPELTGRENVYLNGAILGMTRGEIQKQFDAIVDFSGVEQFLDMPVKRYSSGMYVRLAFAVAAHLNPEILIVDEVLAVGDGDFQKKCLGKMKDVAKTGRTVLFVSHNVPAIQALCSTGIMLAKGEVAYVGFVEECVERYVISSRAPLSTDLRKIPNRQGNGRTKFTEVWLENKYGKRVFEGVSGEPLVVAMRYVSENTNPLYACRFSAGVFTILGHELFNCSSELVANGITCAESAGVVRCRISRLPLSGGEYLICPFVEVGGEFADWLTGGLTLSVVDGDFYGSGKLYPAGWQGKGVLVEHQWSILSAFAESGLTGTQTFC